MEFCILGPLAVRVLGKPVPLGSGKPATLLGVLLLHANEVVPLDLLVDELWGTEPPVGAVRLVQGYVSALRRRLGADRIVTCSAGYSIRIAGGELDLTHFERLVASARIASPEEAANRLREALALWRGPTLADVRFAGLAAQQARRLDDLRLVALLDRFDADLVLGRHRDVVHELEQLYIEHPTDERLCGQLMLALYRCGRHVQALEAFAELRRVLSDDLGVIPGPDVQGLHAAILNHEPMLASSPHSWKPTPTAATPGATLPPPLRLSQSFAFVGRSAELEILRGAAPRTATDGRRMVVVAGEAGSGKSRLVREFAYEMAAEGTIVLYGACGPVASAPYQPIVEALTQLVQHTDPTTLRDDLGAAGGELVRLLPDLARHTGALADPITADPDTERYRLHTAVADLIANTGRRQPVLLIVEDAHWADAGTLLLLRHLARAPAPARLVVLTTYRHPDAEAAAELADVLADLRRAGDFVHIRLGALTDDEIDRFVSAASGGSAQPARSLAAQLREITAGNPFLLCELWRTLTDSGAVVVADGVVGLTGPLADVAATQAVQDAVGARLARLPDSAVAVLDLAAVAGGEFELDTVRRASASLADCVDGMAAAERSGMIEATPSPILTYRFTHELVRRAIYDRHTGVARAHLHSRVGEALAAKSVSPSPRTLAALAHHFTAGLPFVEPEKAVRYNVLAARAATMALAFRQAADRLDLALGIGVEDDAERAQLHLELGTVWLRAGRSLDALDSLHRAVLIARDLGDADLFGRAAIGIEHASHLPHMVGTGAVEILREALAILGPEDSPLRVRLLAGLARALAVHGDHAAAMAVRTRAVGMARRIDDRQGLATALLHASWARNSTDPVALVKTVTEARDVAAEIGDLQGLAEAMALRVSALVAACDIDAARRQLSEATDMATRVRQPFLLHIVEQHTSALALMQGRLDDAEAAAEHAQAWGRLLSGADPSTDYGIQMFGIRREQGRLAEVVPAARDLMSRPPDGVWRAALVALLVELDMTADAERELAAMRSEPLDPALRPLWLASMTYLADACSMTGDAETAGRIYPALEPYAGTNIMIGYSVGYYGAADRYLGMLAATLGHTAAAERHFEAALELNRQMQATTWLAHTCYQYGRLQWSRHPDRARVLLDEASTLAQRVGMPSLLRRMEAVGSTATPLIELPDGLSSREGEVLRLLAGGLSNREIGTNLSISEHTAARHVRSILSKTGCANRTGAAAYAHRHGLAAG
jgi:DNA-binding SARP family transcriptional activator/DNA-binding CsgD family transcriptional regulator/tetratricopeptide (TPR) repeat protein